MHEMTGAGAGGVSWEELKDELLGVEDQVEIERRVERLRAEVWAYRLAEVRKRRPVGHPRPQMSMPGPAVRCVRPAAPHP